ncbi:MAG: cob(I)yrinic acid a,c-diamide adenosyltransferase [Opitutales bacterium]|nr:cob(I)yrinic acid a,c-diamide adenosyltransferase [Opitutales bacterium]
MSKKDAKAKAQALREGNEKGLYLLHTGNGKGKTSAAMNMVYRHLAHDLPAAVVQFVKKDGDFDDGDRKMLRKLNELGFPVTIETLGAGFSWNTQDPDADRKAALLALKKAKVYLTDEKHRLVLLDELHIALRNGNLKLEEVIPVISERTPLKHVITTGRGAPEELIQLADLVTEMKLVKHHVSQKIPAQQGIEF